MTIEQRLARLESGLWFWKAANVVAILTVIGLSAWPPGAVQQLVARDGAAVAANRTIADKVMSETKSEIERVSGFLKSDPAEARDEMKLRWIRVNSVSALSNDQRAELSGRTSDVFDQALWQQVVTQDRAKMKKLRVQSLEVIDANGVVIGKLGTTEPDCP